MKASPLFTLVVPRLAAFAMTVMGLSLLTQCDDAPERSDATASAPPAQESPPLPSAPPPPAETSTSSLQSLGDGVLDQARAAHERLRAAESLTTGTSDTPSGQPAQVAQEFSRKLEQTLHTLPSLTPEKVAPLIEAARQTMESVAAAANEGGGNLAPGTDNDLSDLQDQAAALLQSVQSTADEDTLRKVKEKVSSLLQEEPQREKPE